MRKKVERLERRNRKTSEEAELPKLTNIDYKKKYQDNILELDKIEKQEYEWKTIKKHPLTKIVMVVGITMGLVYMSSHVFNLAAKATTSYKKFRKALES